MHKIRDIKFIAFVLLFFSCGKEKKDTLFTSLSGDQTGIHFSNTIREDDSTLSFIDEFGYMGGGVGIGDFNNDGLKDIFFTGNQVSCRLYINKGNNKFEDITLPAGVATSIWATGVSIVDINNDGYDDIYVCVFGKNLLQPAKNLLFINQHDLTFKEEAEEYGLADTGYSTQAVFFDYDHDGDLDMYLTNYRLNGPNANTLYPKDLSGHSPANDRLYRNEGIPAPTSVGGTALSSSATGNGRPPGPPGPGIGHPVFKDVTLEAGIKEDGYGLGVVASDFNGDGWPDIYVANDFVSNDELWLNNRNGTFTNCIGHSLRHQSYSSMGADAADINNDGRSDIITLDMLPETNERKKLASSFMTYDRYQEERSLGYEPEFMRNMLQLNNGNFPDGDQSNSTIGNTGNAHPQSVHSGIVSPGSIHSTSKHQHIASTDITPAPDKLPAPPVPFFSEIGQFAGISATDWSWSVLMADFDNDGWKDIHITNGIGRDFINSDFLEFSSAVFASTKTQKEQHALIRNKLAALRHINLSNYLYLNNKDYTFTDASRQAGIDERSMSNGAAYVDLDNDGDLDLVVNNINREAFVFINNTVHSISDHPQSASKDNQSQAPGQKSSSQDNQSLPTSQQSSSRDDQSQPSGQQSPSPNKQALLTDYQSSSQNTLSVPPDHHSLSIDLLGDSLNRHGFGAKIWVYTHGQVQMQEQSPVRGYFSSVDQRLIFGLGPASYADSIVINWPGGKRQVTWPIKADQLLLLRQKDAVDPASAKPGQGHLGATKNTDSSRATRTDQDQTYPAPRLFTDITTATRAFYRHLDAPYNDFTAQRLLPQKYSQLGPFITTGDINGDGLQDFFVGGGFNSSGRIFLQKKDATFSSYNLSDSIKMQEDEDCILFDADGDGDLDLLITCGDTRYEDSSEYYRPRLYSNDGKGHFTLQPMAIPSEVRTIAGCVSIGDYDGDGDLDIFIGGRVAGTYPLAPRSYLLQNNKGRFTDVTATVCPALERPGMVTSAVWADLDGDHQPDLVIAGEWMPIRFFHNEHGHLREKTDSTGLTQMNGMWRSLTITDMDGDGDLDIVAGNLGLNCEYQADTATPMLLLAKDLDGNGSIDPLLFYYIKDNDGIRRPFPAINRVQFARQVPAIKKRFLYNRDYARAGLDDLFRGWSKEGALRLSCNETRSCYFENKGHGKFIKHPLPQEAQFAPVNTLLCEDLDHDGYKDILLAGNEYQTEVMTGRYDASYGCFLKGNKGGTFTAIPSTTSGLILKGDIKNIKSLRSATGQTWVIVAVNNDSLRVLEVK